MALFFAVFFCAVCGLTYFAYTSSRKAMFQEFEIRGRTLAKAIASQARTDYQEQDIEGLTSLLQSLGEGEDVVAILAYRSSKVLWIEFSGIQLTAEDLAFPELGDPWQRDLVLTKGYRVSAFRGVVIDLSAPARKDTPVAAQPLGWIRIFLDRSALEQRLGKLIKETLVASMVTLVLGGALFILLLRRSLHVIGPLTEATKRVAEGDLHTTVPVSSRDELGELAQCFNSMTEQLLQTTVSKNYVDNIFRSMIDTLIVVNPDGTIASVNRAALHLLGYEEHELLGQHITILFPQQKNLFAKQTYEELVRKGAIDHGETTYLAKDGRAIPMLFSAAAMRDEDGRMLGIACVAKDVTERKRAEGELLASQEYNRTLFELSPIGLALFKMDGTVTDCNEAYATITGRTREETIGLTYWELTPNKYDDAAKEIMATLTKTGSFQHYEKHYVHHDGHLVPVRLFGNLIERDNNLYIFCSVEDISDRRKGEEALKAAHKKLTELNETRSEFLANISHELRTPLTVIRGEAEVTIRGKDKPIVEYKAVLQRIVQLTNQVNQLVGDLLFISRSESGTIEIDKQPTPLLKILLEMHQEARVLAERKRITVTLNSQNASPIIVNGDPQRLRQLLMIIITNAINYTKPEGAITVNLDSDGTSARITVADNGVGISEEDLPYVFQRFYRVKQRRQDLARGGSGLGLPIAKWIAEAHNGRISIASVLERGTTVTVELPLYEPRTPGSE